VSLRDGESLDFEVVGPLWSQRTYVGREGVLFFKQLTVPPGVHRVELRPHASKPGFQIDRFLISELEGGPVERASPVAARR
jgi:hypothetical protein